MKDKLTLLFDIRELKNFLIADLRVKFLERHDIDELVEYWFMSRLDDICLIPVPHHTTHHVRRDPKNIRVLQTLNPTYESLLYRLVRVPPTHYDRYASVVLSGNRLCLVYE